MHAVQGCFSLQRASAAPAGLRHVPRPEYRAAELRIQNGVPVEDRREARLQELAQDRGVSHLHLHQARSIDANVGTVRRWQDVAALSVFVRARSGSERDIESIRCQALRDSYHLWVGCCSHLPQWRQLCYPVLNTPGTVRTSRPDVIHEPLGEMPHAETPSVHRSNDINCCRAGCGQSVHRGRHLRAVRRPQPD
jgi:hypothetical protein